MFSIQEVVLFSAHSRESLYHRPTLSDTPPGAIMSGGSVPAWSVEMGSTGMPIQEHSPLLTFFASA